MTMPSKRGKTGTSRVWLLPGAGLVSRAFNHVTRAGALRAIIKARFMFSAELCRRILVAEFDLQDGGILVSSGLKITVQFGLH